MFITSLKFIVLYRILASFGEMAGQISEGMGGTTVLVKNGVLLVVFKIRSSIEWPHGKKDN